ncbi:hypothetical protein CLV35_1648 [Motilibacter peucedani]|uniref:EVE domain-containing protein n=1 Tax=Motilibacter peucedani TaxID=598650 RepID=A0A420XST1_9ACTN|nr:hypothetical protein [Motilibacter peucedani]RKS77943.1 hypothetical protein CLV35_1648 [Motilibacter peucedani]
MATYVVNYNPLRATWGPADRARAVGETARGRRVAERWSTGGRTSGVVPGDRAVLLRQGPGRRGLIGRGTFTSTIYRDAHWDGSPRDANYADILWDVLLDDADVISLEEVRAVAPSVPWNHLQGSGVRVRPPDDVALERLWATFARGPAGE